MLNIDIPAIARAKADEVIGRSDWSALVTKHDVVDQPKIKDPSYAKEIKETAEMRPLGRSQLKCISDLQPVFIPKRHPLKPIHDI